MNREKLEEEGHWGATQTMVGFDIDDTLRNISIPDAKISGDRVLFGRLSENQGSLALEVVTLHQVRCRIEDSRPPDALWGPPTGPIDLSLQYTDERAICVNFPSPAAWKSIWNSSPSYST